MANGRRMTKVIIAASNRCCPNTDELGAYGERAPIAIGRLQNSERAVPGTHLWQAPPAPGDRAVVGAVDPFPTHTYELLTEPLSALEQLLFGSNDGIWPRGDAP